MSHLTNFNALLLKKKICLWKNTDLKLYRLVPFRRAFSFLSQHELTTHPSIPPWKKSSPVWHLFPAKRKEGQHWGHVLRTMGEIFSFSLKSSRTDWGQFVIFRSAVIKASLSLIIIIISHTGLKEKIGWYLVIKLLFFLSVAFCFIGWIIEVKHLNRLLLSPCFHVCQIKYAICLAWGFAHINPDINYFSLNFGLLSTQRQHFCPAKLELFEDALPNG